MQKTRSRVTVEKLEGRRMMSVTFNSAGWTVVTHDSNARVIYVSTSGKDSNNGTSSSSPVASLSKAYSMMRNDSDDEMLLQSGDTFNNTFGQFKIAGESSQLPLLIGTYGSGNRPVIDCGTGNGLIANTVHSVSNLIIDGVVFTDNGRDPTKTSVSSSAAAAQSTGLQLLGPSTNVTIENCEFTYFKDNIDLQSGLGSVNNITIRRSTIADSYCTSTRSQGLYATSVNNVTLDQDVFEHNGWNSSISGAQITGYNHDIYYSETALGMVVTNNVIADASSDGVLARGGGIIDNNLFLNDAVGVSFGNANGATSTAGGVVGQINNNVFIGNHPIGSTKLGEGIEIGNVRANSGVTISGNIFTGDDELSQPAINLVYATSTSNPGSCVGINDLTISNNIVDGWRDGLYIANFKDGGKGINGLNDVKIINNQFQNTSALLINHANSYSSSQEHWSGNTYYTTSSSKPFYLAPNDVSASNWKSMDPTGVFSKVTYTDPTRTAASYDATQGGGDSVSAFVARTVTQSSVTWGGGYPASGALAYIRAGFNVGAGNDSVIATPSSSLTKLTGSTIGTSGSYQNDGDTISKVFDGSTSSYFDGPVANGDWVGLDLGSAKTVKQISFAPRSGWASRMVGGVFQASNSSNFSIGVVTLYTINSAPAQGSLTTVTTDITGNYRYVRYLSPNGGYGNVSEINFYG